MKYWMVKSEPGEYAWDDLVRDGQTLWDGVRNYQARNNLQQMQKGDLVLFYHSVKQKRVMGIARVSRTNYPDPTTDDARWVVVDLEPVEALPNPVELEQIKADPRLQNLALIRQPRLSVMPVSREAFDAIVERGHNENQRR